MMTTAMMNAMIEAGIVKEWHMGDMHRLYINLKKADMLYREHCEEIGYSDSRLISLNLSAGEIKNGMMWIDMESGEIDVKYIKDEEIAVKQIIALAAFLSKDEENEEIEETAKDSEITELKEYFAEQYILQLNIYEKHKDVLEAIRGVAWKVSQELHAYFTVICDIYRCRREYTNREEFDLLIKDLREEYGDDDLKTAALDTILFDLREIERAKYID